uniref:TSA: Wollemia nobilis Ref_Wollemi_Transcript_13011_2716 transcribed RNA sequence n=1 Tax=Wollemia nobilis TaxID=56998 RepID=A0A0C9RU26_9CONI
MLRRLLCATASHFYLEKAQPFLRRGPKLNLQRAGPPNLAAARVKVSRFSSCRVQAMAERVAEQSGPKKYTNRLAGEQSPYLLQHQHNPVDWYPWGEEAFAKARNEDKPIFLSIGYSTCHWCHVMEVESFENEEVAKLLNDWFVSIKVDREERPDVDKVYMTYVQVVYGGGGWPLSVFLTPDLKPMMGGTYFPPDDKYGRPGFKTVLRRVKEAWDAKKSLLHDSGDNAIRQLAEALSASSVSRELTEGLPQQAVELCANQLAKSYDSKYGGFGSAPKFPRPVEIQLMLHRYKRLDEAGKETLASTALEMALFTLQCMARGGVHDHLGGGFHRYSVDEHWHVPHFEKMLYDQGQLVVVYLHSFAIGKDTVYSSVARDILDYLKRDMINQEGGLYSAEDADSAEFEGAPRKKEGAFYVWTTQEIEEVLGKEAAELFMRHYYVKPGGNCDLSRMSDPHNEFVGKNVLIEREGIPEMALKLGMNTDEYSHILGTCRDKLFMRRCCRPRPHLDDKIIVAWNGLAISAFAKASKTLKIEPKEIKYYFPVTGCDPIDYLHVAERAAYFIKSRLYDKDTHRLTHSFRQGPSQAPGFLDDYAFLIAGLLDLYEAGGETKWLSWAVDLQATQDDLFLDKVGGGYFNTPGEDPSILLRLKEDYDGAEPSGNSVSAINLLRLSSIVSGNLSDSYSHTAEHLLAVFETRIKEQAMAVPLMCCAADLLTVPSRQQVVIVGPKSTPNFESLVVASHAPYDPNKTIIQIDPSNEEDSKFWQAHNPTVFSIAQKSPEGKALAYVCQNFMCNPPISDPLTLEQLLRQPQKPSTYKVGGSSKT